jgi:hypothetical protein
MYLRKGTSLPLPLARRNSPLAPTYRPPDPDVNRGTGVQNPPIYNAADRPLRPVLVARHPFAVALPSRPSRSMSSASRTPFRRGVLWRANVADRAPVAPLRCPTTTRTRMNSQASRPGGTMRRPTAPHQRPLERMVKPDPDASALRCFGHHRVLPRFFWARATSTATTGQPPLSHNAATARRE